MIRILRFDVRLVNNLKKNAQFRPRPLKAARGNETKQLVSRVVTWTVIFGIR